MCVKLPKALNPFAEEWRPTSAAPPLPPPENNENLNAVQERKKSQLQRPKKAPKKFLPPRLRRAALRYQNEAPPPPIKLEWRPKNTPPPPAASKAPKTTLMIRNIPNHLRRDFMLKFLDGYCRTHSLEYDFFYLPIDFRRLGNLGYAFVNFTTAAAAVRMKKILSHYKWRAIYEESGELVSSKKICEMTWARIQGKEALVRRFEKSNFKCGDEDFLPVVLDPPRNGSDPNPPPPRNLGRLCGPAL